jgi:ketosteroid isomerase-like protein
VLALFDPDIEIYAPPDLANSGTYHGHDGYLQWLGGWIEAWDEFRIELVDVIVVDDANVIALADQHGRGQGSGIEVQQRGIAYLFTIRDGRAVRFHLYPSREAAMAALG